MGGSSDGGQFAAHAERRHARDEADGSGPSLAWWESQREERLRRRERSGKTVCALALVEGLLVFFVATYAVADYRNGTRSWHKPNADLLTANTLVQLLPDLPALATASVGERSASPPPKRDQSRVAARRRVLSAEDHTLSTDPETPRANDSPQRDFDTEVSVAAPDLGRLERVLPAERPRRVEPEEVQKPDAKEASNSALSLIMAPPMKEAQDLERPPELRFETLRLRYPRDAQRNRAEGLVVLHFYVDEQGRISTVRVLTSVHPSLERAAVKALYAARFRPGREGNRNVGTFAKITVRFMLR